MTREAGARARSTVTSLCATAIEAQDLDNDGYYEIGGLRPDIHVPWSDEDFTKGNQDVNYDPTLQAALDYIFKHLGD